MPFYIHRIADLYAPGCQTEVRIERQGTIYTQWVNAVCIPYTGGRLWAAWEVLRGRAYAFEWPKPGDLERIVLRSGMLGNATASKGDAQPASPSEER